MPEQPPTNLTRVAMWEIILDLRGQVSQSQAKVTALEAEIKQLNEQLRESKRAKAPFSKNKRKSDRKKPGRKRKEGNFTNRQAPEPRSEDTVVDVDASLEIDQRDCPDCKVPLVISQELATIEDAPAVPTRVITRIHVEIGKCPCCGFLARAKHPLLAPSQNGANVNILGPNVVAQALALNYYHGLPMRKVPQVILSMTGIAMTQSALTQRACNLCDEGGLMEPIYQELKNDIAKSTTSHTDDTGWRIDAVLAFVMGFFTQNTAYYQIRYHHRVQEVREVIPVDYAGTVVTDRAATYRAHEFDDTEMQRCLSHLLSNIKKVEEQKTGPAKSFSTNLKHLLQTILALWKSYQAKEIGEAEYRKRGEELADELTHMLRSRKLTDPDNQRLLDGIGLEHSKGRVLLFLEKEGVPPTNNLAERMLRPAVIARKVSQCSKNERGARAYATMKSICVTLKLRGANVAKGLASLLKGESFKEASKC